MREAFGKICFRKNTSKIKRCPKSKRKRVIHNFEVGLMEVKKEFLDRGRFVVHKGNQVHFWEDLWIGNKPLMKEFPSLYNIVRNKHITVAKVLSTIPLGISFRRGMTGNNLALWHKLVGMVAWVQLDNHKDTFSWSLSKTFTVDSMYKDLMKGVGLMTECINWKVKLPLKIKFSFGI
jgi:hypothetical protein